MSTVVIDRHGPVTAIGINRPDARNAVDRPTADALTEAFLAFDADRDSSVAVLYGVGGHFCAGADLKAIGTDRGNRAAPDGDGPMGPSRLLLGKPVIAAVAGHAVAGGLELACWCDMRVVEENAVFGVFCRRWGVPLIDGGTVRLPRIVGRGHAMDMILTGRPVGAEEARQMGLANRIVPPGASLDAAIELGQELARFPQATMRADRLSALEGEGLLEAQALAQEFARGEQVLGEAVEGAGRFSDGHGRHGDFGDI